MKISTIGHASIFVETQDYNFLMDPVLWDPHQEGLFDICPQREVQVENIPKFDVLIISHKHLDHFDIRSLAYLPKDVDVIIPKDTLIERSLKQLGYERIYKLADFQELKFGSTKIMTTRSENRVPEFGIVFADSSGVFWNCVDTVLAPETIKHVLQKFSQITFLLATWQPMMEGNFQNNASLQFPYGEYGQLLYSISLINPQAIAPGANAFKYIDAGSWLNQIVFPVSRERFCHDVTQVCSYLKDNVYPLDPGDTVEFSQEQITFIPNGCEFVQKIKDDREELDFFPVNIGHTLIDKNPDGFNLDTVEDTIHHKLKHDLTLLLQAKEKSFEEHHRWQVIYQLEIIYPDRSEKWHCDFSQKPFVVSQGRHPLANYCVCTTASGFYSLIQQVKGWDYLGLGGYHRNFQKIYQATPLGLVLPQYTDFIDPFAMLFEERELEIAMRDLEIKQWKDYYSASKIDFTPPMLAS